MDRGEDRVEVVGTAGEDVVAVGREAEGGAEIELRRWMPYESRRSNLAPRATLERLNESRSDA